MGNLEELRLPGFLQVTLPWNAGHLSGGEEAEEAESSVLLPQLFLIAPIREQGTTLGPIQANGKSLLRFSFLTI